jgi:F-type H+-transporting ATPase subunit alpha
MRQVAGRLKLEMAQFGEVAAFAQFGAELDQATRRQLDRGLRIREILKQPQYEPMPLEQQVMILYAVTHGHLDGVERIEDIKEWEQGFVAFVAKEHPSIGKAIVEERVLSDESTEALEAALAEFKEVWARRAGQQA